MKLSLGYDLIRLDNKSASKEQKNFPPKIQKELLADQ